MLDAKRALLLAISHELRSPLTRARLNAELVAEGDARDALLRDLGEMRDLITALLENERLAAGHAALQREATDLEELLRGLLAETSSASRLTLKIEPGLPSLALDRTRMRLLLRNLIDNALRHGGTAATSPVLSLRRAEDAIEMTLRDFGPGVAPQHLERLAEPFYRVDAARQRSTGGVGLGLALCRLVAQAHRGSLTLRNAEPGFEAVVRLPL
jgi:signal transduction histidine kinase